MKTWTAQDAKAHFGAFLEATLKEGPQVVTDHGVEAAVLVSAEAWRRMTGTTARPRLKDLLLAPEPRTEQLTPPRPAYRHRTAPTFS